MRQVQILDETDSLSHITNTLGKCMSPTTLPPASGNYSDRVVSLTLVWKPVGEKENLEFKPVKLRLNIDNVSHPVHSQGLVNTP